LRNLRRAVPGESLRRASPTNINLCWTGGLANYQNYCSQFTIRQHSACIYQARNQMRELTISEA